MAKRRLSETITDNELDNSRLIRRLFLQELDDIKDSIGAKCRSCNNTWYVRIIGIALLLIAAWVGTIQTELNITPNKAIQAVAGESVKVIMKGVTKAGG